MIGSLTEARDQLAAIEKAKRRKRRESDDRDQADEEPAVVTGAHHMAEGYRDGMADEGDSQKGFAERGAVEGPGHNDEPGHAEAGDFRRGYIDAGHAADSPQAEPPRRNPMHHGAPGVLQPIVLPDAPFAARIPAAVAANFTMNSPSDHGAR